MKLELYGDIFQGFFGEDETLVNVVNVTKKLNEMGDEKELDLIIHCNGGDVLEGLALYDLLRTSGKDISATVNGGVHSAAMLLLLTAEKKKRRCTTNSTALLHNVQTGVDGNANDIANALIEQVMLEERVIDIYSERTGLTREKARELLDSSRLYKAEELLQLGFVSEIIKYNTNSIRPMKTNVKDILARAVQFVANANKALGYTNFDYKDKDGKVIFSIEGEEDKLAQGDAVTLSEGTDPNGEFELEDGRKVSLADGKVEAIVKPDDKSGDTTAPDAPSPDTKKMEELIAQLEEAKGLVETLRTALQSNYNPENDLNRMGQHIGTVRPNNTSTSISVEELKKQINASRNK